ncbi:YdcP family protein [Streptococcus pasteurianus]|nr:YdcP family protein [Streptococcus pasteurianus]WOO57821.1 YdcP family protein [Streptococcus pasteurianus]
MEMKYVVPDMAQSFGTLEFAGESEPVFERDKNNRRVLARRSYNLYSDVQKGENVVVEIPVQAGEKKFKYEQKVKLVNPVADTVSRKTFGGADVDWYVKAEDIVLKNKGNQNAGNPQNHAPQGQPKK